MISFGSNISRSIQRQLDTATSAVSNVYERLSSGQRINHASDDAAGLAVASSLSVQSRLFDKAVRNVSDGISALNIAASALQNQNEIIIRMRELAEQSANGTYSNSQRQAISKEYTALQREFGRIGDTTTFNGQNLLLAGRGSNASNINFQVGIDGTANSRVGATLTDSGSISGIVYGIIGVEAPAEPIVGLSIDELLSGTNGAIRMTVNDNNGNSRDLLLAIWSSDTEITLQAYIKAEQSNGLVSNINNDWVYAGASQSFTLNSMGKISGATNANLTVSGFAGGATAQLNLDLSGLTVQSVLGSNPELANGFNVSNIELTGIETRSTSLSAMRVLSQRQQDLSSSIGNIGAMQSRLMSANNLLENQNENTQVAKSRISDADVASEVAKLISGQIRQSAASNVLKLANDGAKLILDLL